MTAVAPARRLWLALTLAAIFSLPASAQEEWTVYEVRSRYQLITVLDTADGYRQLIFDGRFDGTDAIQSEMNLAKLDELTLSYAQHIMTVLPVVEKRSRILIVGLGGACMQRYLYRLLPDATIETAELDPEVRKAAAEYFFFREDNRQILHLGDGRKFIEDSKEKYDIIFLDAFSAVSIPHALTTQEFLEAVKDRLAEGGAVCANLWEDAADYPDMLKTYSTVFAELRIVKCSPNVILLALPNKTGLTIKAWAARAEAFEKKHPTGLNLPQLIDRAAAETTEIPANAKVLRDKDKDTPTGSASRRGEFAGRRTVARRQFAILPEGSLTR